MCLGKYQTISKVNKAYIYIKFRQASVYFCLSQTAWMQNAALRSKLIFICLD